MNIPTKDQVTNTGTFSGEGAFASVYVLPGKQAVKVSEHAHADAWLWWAVYVLLNKYKMEHDSDVLPNIYGIRIDVANNSYTAMLDELFEPADFDPFFENESSVHRHVAGLRSLTDCELCHDIDLEYNWMVTKGGAFQITDPVCYRGWTAMKAHPERNFNFMYLLDFIRSHPELDQHIEIVGI